VSAAGRVAATAVIVSATVTAEAMAAPAVAIAPAGPGTHAQEDAIVEIARSVESHGGAGVGSVVVVAVRTDRLNPDVDDELSVGRWRQGQAG
jgi:hypothetical protein